MKHLTGLTVITLLLNVVPLAAGTLYVSLLSTNPVAPYTNWATAAVTIQDAVDAAVGGDEIVVTNGSYATGARVVNGNATSNRVAVTKAVTVRSVNGPQVTIIRGYQVPVTTNDATAIRCVWLTNGATLSGFTLTNGATQNSSDPYITYISLSGGGVCCRGPSAVVSNCVLRGNSASSYGGGAYEGTLNNCTITGNSASSGGGASDATLNNCTLTSNSANHGGGVYEGTLNNCTLTGNSASSSGGGAHYATLNNCTLSGNSAWNGGAASYGTVNNCTLSGNSGWLGGGAVDAMVNNSTLTGNSANDGGGAYDGTLNNCTLLGNSASSSGGGASAATLNNCTLTGNSANDGGGTYRGTLNNCIAYYNSAKQGSNDYSGGSLNYCCTTPLPASGAGNITNAPLFANTNAWANLRLLPDSPCVNAGNNAYVVGSTDRDGNPRIAGGTVDVGAYETPDTHYVSLASSNPVWPYRSWATAATNIQAAVDAAGAGVQIVVSNGIYEIGARAVYGMSNRVAVTKPVTLRSLNGPEHTIIRGYHVAGTNNGPTAIRCVYLTNGATLSGFTLTNGATQASGDTSLNQSGGGVWCETSNAVVSNCVLRGNTASFGGGGAYRATLNHCALSGNSANLGGGAYLGTLNHCTLSGNFAFTYGGGAYSGVLNNCTLTGNSVFMYGGGSYGSMLTNCIAYYNSATVSGANYRSSTFDHCCTDPLPSGAQDGGGNLSYDPLFVDYAGGNLRLQSNSPCINSGINSYVTNFTDLDGNLRIVGGTVDVGVYEYQAPSSVLCYAWAQQYGLPTDGSADGTDTDGDGLNNWQEWITGTVPTNAASVFRLLSAVPTGSDVTVRWQSVAGIIYFLQRSPTLAPAGFQTIAANLSGQTGTSTYVDTNAASPGPLFYRAGVGTPTRSTASNLVCEWRFEGNPSDTSGNGNEGTITGSPSYVSGKFGQAIYLNRADSIQKTNALNLPVAGTNSWSCNVWFYLTNAPDTLAYLCGFGNVSSTSPRGTARGLLAYGGSGNNGIYSWGAELDLGTGQSYPLNQWTMVTITHDGVTGTRRIWIDANLAATGVFPLNNTLSTISAGVTAWTGREFQGALDEFTVWSGALGTNEIRSLFLYNDIIH